MMKIPCIKVTITGGDGGCVAIIDCLDGTQYVVPC